MSIAITVGLTALCYFCYCRYRALRTSAYDTLGVIKRARLSRVRLSSIRNIDDYWSIAIVWYLQAFSLITIVDIKGEDWAMITTKGSMYLSRYSNR